MNITLCLTDVRQGGTLWLANLLFLLVLLGATEASTQQCFAWPHLGNRPSNIILMT